MKRELKPSTVLKKALKALETKGWTKHTFARDSRGLSVDPRAQSACKFCAWGALRVITESVLVLNQCLQYLDGSNKHHCIVTFNDAKTTRFTQIKQAYTKAIKLAQAEGK